MNLRLQLSSVRVEQGFKCRLLLRKSSVIVDIGVENSILRCRTSILILCCLGLVGCSQNNRLAADEDAFVSYLQSASSLTNQLELKFDDSSKRQRISGLVVLGATEPVDRIDGTCEQVLKFKKVVSSLPTDKCRQLSQTHKGLVRTTKNSCEKLKQLKAKKPRIITEDWERYWQALSPILEL